jgi:hypothetical protein
MARGNPYTPSLSKANGRVCLGAADYLSVMGQTSVVCDRMKFQGLIVRAEK